MFRLGKYYLVLPNTPLCMALNKPVLALLNDAASLAGIAPLYPLPE